MRKGGLKFFLLAIIVAVIGFGILLTTLFLLSPYKIGTSLDINNIRYNVLSIIVFYIGLFIFFMGLFSTIFFWLRSRVRTKDDLYLYAVTSFRQGILMGILICILLLLQSFQLFVWWDALLVVGAIILIEMYLAVR